MATNGHFASIGDHSDKAAYANGVQVVDENKEFKYAPISVFLSSMSGRQLGEGPSVANLTSSMQPQSLKVPSYRRCVPRRLQLPSDFRLRVPVDWQVHTSQ